MSNTQTLYVHGMHCASCALLIEDKLAAIEGIDGVRANLSSRTVECACTLEVGSEELAALLTPHVNEYGYSISVEPEKKRIRWKEFAYAIPIALAVVAGFVLIQGLGIVNLIHADSVTLPLAFLIGLVASLSTCMAVVGGLVLSMAATYGKEGNGRRSQLMFHAGRIIGFFILGGVIGLIGSAFTLTPAISFGLSLVVGFVMLVLGLNLLDIFQGSAGLQLRMPKLFSMSRMQEKFTGQTAPFLIGAATFFLPCGFTQSMQVYALSTGSITKGALTMLFFALGTLPILALISFGVGNIAQSKHRGVFFKAAGIVVILFALFNITLGMIAVGLIPPLFNF